VAKKIQVDMDIGQKQGVQSTPTFFINGKMVVGVFELTKEIEKYLK
jgi:protein-disulfide isomerase